MTRKEENFDDLTDMQRLFAEFYLSNGNASRSAELAGYSERTSATQGSRLLKNPKVSRYMNHLKKERAYETDIQPEHVRALVANLANPTSGASQTTQLKALELLMRHFGMLVERKEVTSETNINIHNPENMTDEELDKMLEEYEKLAIEAEYEVIDDD